MQRARAEKEQEAADVIDLDDDDNELFGKTGKRVTSTAGSSTSMTPLTFNLIVGVCGPRDESKFSLPLPCFDYKILDCLKLSALATPLRRWWLNQRRGYFQVKDPFPTSKSEFADSLVYLL